MTVLDPNQELPPPSPQTTTPKTGTTRPQMLIALLVLAAALIVLAFITSPFWAPDAAQLLPWGRLSLTAAKAADAAVRELQRRVDDDEAELKHHAAQLSRLDEIEAAIKDHETRLSRLETRPIANNASSPAAPASPDQRSESAAAIRTLEDEIEKLTANNSATSDRIAKLETNIKTAIASNSAQRARLIALANVRIAAEGAAPFAAELAAAQALAGDDTATRDALASLADSAKAGLPTIAALAERFDRSIAPAILRSPQDANASWWQQMRSRIERLVVIRHIGPGGPPPRDPAEVAVTKADAALRVGDLAAAIGALNILPANAAKAAAPWVVLAKQRLKTETTLAMLWRNETARSSPPQPGNSR
jgi:hypothetical protein